MTDQRPANAKVPTLPKRYDDPWVEPFERRCQEVLASGVRVLDIGGGRRPSIPPSARPSDCVYVGLDTSAEQLHQAGPGAYDEVHVASATQFIPVLEQSFDLIVSWQTLEHVRPLEAALANAHAYLRPGARFVALVSGTFAVFSIVGRLLPHSVGAAVMHRLLGREPDTVFPAYYDRCWHGALVKLLRPWSRAEIVPLYRGAGYFGFSRALTRAYLGYENWALRGRHDNLATHYLIEAER